MQPGDDIDGQLSRARAVLRSGIRLLALWIECHRYGRVADHLLCDAAEQQSFDAGVSVRCHANEVGTVLGSFGHVRCRNIDAHDGVQFDLLHPGKPIAKPFEIVGFGLVVCAERFRAWPCMWCPCNLGQLL